MPLKVTGRRNGRDPWKALSRREEGRGLRNSRLSSLSPGFRPQEALVSSCPLLSPSISPPFKFHFLLSYNLSLLDAKVAYHVPDCKSTNAVPRNPFNS